MKQADRDREKVLDMIAGTAQLVHMIGCRECAEQLRQQAGQIADAFAAARAAAILERGEQR